VARHAFLAQLPFDDVLGGDARVIRTRKPESCVSLHPLSANEDVLHGVIECVTRMEHTRDVGRWDDDAVWLASRVDLRPEGAGLLPYRVPARLDRFWLIRLVHDGLHSRGTLGDAVYRSEKPGDPSPGSAFLSIESISRLARTERSAPLQDRSFDPYRQDTSLQATDD